VDEEEVEVVKLEVFQALQKSWSDFLGAVFGIPKFGGHKQVITGHDALLQDHCNGVTDLVLVFVVRGAVDVPIARSDGVGDGAHKLALAGAGFLPPGPVANHGHRVPTAECGRGPYDGRIHASVV